MYKWRIRTSVGEKMKTKTFDMFIDLKLQCNRYIGLLPMNVNNYTFLSSLILTHVFIS